MKTVCKKSFPEWGIIKGQIYDVHFNWENPDTKGWFNQKHISVLVIIENGVDCVFSKDEGPIYFYTPDEMYKLRKQKLEKLNKNGDISTS